MIERHLYFEDGDGRSMRVEPSDPTGHRLLLTVPDGDVEVGQEEAAHLILHLAAYLAATTGITDD